MASQLSTLNRSARSALRPEPSEGSRSRRRAKRGGFALLIVLTLVAFVLVLLLGLAAYTRVETAISGNTQRQAQARQHALVALDVALAQLQKNAGPDQRVTATGESTGGANAHYTGVWSSDPTATPSTTPLTWLVSGSETPANNALAAVQLVGPQSAGTGNNAAFVTAPLVNLKSFGVPGQAANDTTAIGGTTIGHYAWWIGDQGVKAPVALGDNTAAVNYPPFVAQDADGNTIGTDLRDRIGQQISLGAGATDATGATVFEPRDTANVAPVKNVTAFSQLAFLKTPAPAAVGLATVQKNVHTWSPNNFNVLANTRLGGLRQDLSLKPELLGAAFSAWTNYSSYLEPISGSDPLRRRYIMQPPVTADGAVTSVAPVLSYFLLAFNVRTQPTSSGSGSTAANALLQVRARWMISLWTPYPAALVPEENLRLEITGLPLVTIDDEEPPRHVVTDLNLDSAFGSPFSIGLPWTGDNSSPDRQSWLPGRVYSWASKENLAGTPPDSSGFASEFYTRSLDASGGQGVQVAIPGVTVDGDHENDLHVRSNQTLTLKLIVTRADGDVTLATFTSPQFSTFVTTDQKFSAGTYQFAYVFRHGESLDGGTWLANAASDPHRGTLGPESFVYQATEANPESPASFAGFKTISAPDRLLDRATDSLSYNEDTPLFELPRAPLLSLGALQHLALDGQRPFAIGNSWAGTAQLNGINVTELFDRYFFSGLVSSVAPVNSNGALLLPNPMLKPLRNPATGVAVTLADLQGAGAAQSSKFLLQGGAFNLNSTNATAWAAVLRGVRFPAPANFKYLDADPATGTADDATTATVQSGDAQFFRFSQSAQETYKAEAGNSGGTASTELFRKGMITLTSTQVSALASAITTTVKTRHGASGPFLSLEEFLSPGTAGGPSLLEQAITDSAVNSAVTEFSSQFLTQADIMTALAPVLFPRSDTFVIRTYGEAVNPATSAIEGKAWCEATVQRVPEFLGKEANAQPEETAPAELNDFNKIYGRRFKIISFRWLTRSDI